MTDIKKGLAGVVVDYTAVSKVNPETNSLLYRGYPVQELAATQPFEAVAFLLWNGELPTEVELAQLRAVEREYRTLAPDVRAVIDHVPLDAHPMDEVRTAVSLIGAKDLAGSGSVLDASGDPEENLARSIRLFAAIPAIVAYGQRRRRGLEPVAPRDDLDYSANFLWMTFGEEADPVVVDAFNRSMVLYAEHSFNASTFTGRVIASTLSDLYSAVTGAIGALKGPLHGGANEAVLHIFDEIGTAENVGPWLDAALAEKRKIMGFGHRVYKRGDSRVPTMKAALDTLVEHYDRPDVLALYDTLESEFVERKGIYPNLDYPSGPAYNLIGFDTLTFTPLFLAARVTGWTAHIMEQFASNALIRPLSEYNGPDERHIEGYVADTAVLETAVRAEGSRGMMRDAVIVDVVRTPSGRGKPGGALSGVHPVDLAAGVLTSILERNGLESRQIDDVIVGCVSQIGDQSLNIGRQAVLAAGFDETVPATTIDRQCGSSQQAAHFAAQGVIAGAYDIVIAAGVESMSRVPLGSSSAGGTVACGIVARYPEGLVNQGVSAVLIAARWGFGREELDAFAAESHRRAADARSRGAFDSQIVPVGEVVTDETVRAGTTADRLAGLAPAFRTDEMAARFPEIAWSITPGNSSPLTDAASAVLIMSADRAAELGLTPRARFHAFSVVGDDPLLMLTGPIPATRRILERSGLSIDDLDAYEVNEAFASVPLAWQRELDADPAKLNPWGGAIALGHAVGASGTRLLGTLVAHLEATGGRYGLQTMCEGGGLANATIVERM